MSIPHKKRVIQYTKRDCNEFAEYWVIDADGGIATCSPARWHRVNLPDETDPATLEKVARMRYIKVRTQFNKQVDDNTWLRANPPPPGIGHHAHLCQHLGIAF